MKKKINRKKIFLTGHKGLVGSEFYKLLKKRYDIKLFVKNRTQLDLFNYDSLNKYIKKIKPNIIINCAAKVGGIEANKRDKFGFYVQNHTIQQNLINASIDNSIDKLVFLGSSCIYSSNFVVPIKENQISFNQLEESNEGYSLSKLMGHKLLQFANSQYNLDFLYIMPCNIFGKNSDFNSTQSHVLEALVRKLIISKKINSKEIVVWGDGKNRREFITADNLAINTINLIDKNYSGVFNIGLGYDFSIKQLISKIKKIINHNPRVYYDKLKPKGTFRKVLNIKKIKQTGVHVTCNFDKELKEFTNFALNKFK